MYQLLQVLQIYWKLQYMFINDKNLVLGISYDSIFNFKDLQSHILKKNWHFIVMEDFGNMQEVLTENLLINFSISMGLILMGWWIIKEFLLLRKIFAEICDLWIRLISNHVTHFLSSTIIVFKYVIVILFFIDNLIIILLVLLTHYFVLWIFALCRILHP